MYKQLVEKKSALNFSTWILMESRKKTDVIYVDLNFLLISK